MRRLWTQHCGLPLRGVEPEGGAAQHRRSRCTLGHQQELAPTRHPSVTLNVFLYQKKIANTHEKHAAASSRGPRPCAPRRRQASLQTASAWCATFSTGETSRPCTGRVAETRTFTSNCARRFCTVVTWKRRRRRTVSGTKGRRLRHVRAGAGEGQRQAERPWPLRKVQERQRQVGRSADSIFRRGDERLLHVPRLRERVDAALTLARSSLAEA